MINILMYISSGLIIAAFIGYTLLIIINNRISIDVDGFNMTKDILNEYNSINIIENKGYFTIYNMRRKVIKIASSSYYGNSVSNVSIPLMEAGISVIHNNKNKFILFMEKIVSNLKYLYILPVIAIIFNYISSGIVDAKIGIFLLIIFSIISYLLINIKTEAVMWIDSKLKDKNLKIIKFLNTVILFDKFIFIGELLMIIKFVAVILNFN